MTPAADAPVVAARDLPMSVDVMASARVRSWKLCLFLLFATALSYLDRQALSTVSARIQAELALDNEGLGRLFAGFFVAYAVGNLVVGTILDRFRSRFVYPGFVAAWSLAQMLTGAAHGFASLLGARLLLGLFEAAAQPGAARIIARSVPARDRSLASGVMMSGGSLGAMAAGPLVLGLSGVVGWRWAFVLLGAAGLLWAAAWVIWYRPEATGGNARAECPEPLRALLRRPGFWACVGGAGFTIPIIHVLSSWVPPYLVQTWKLPLGVGLGAYLLLIYAGLDVGFLAGGAVVSLLVRRGASVPRARKMVMAVGSGMMALAALVPAAPSLPAAVALVALVAAGRAAWGANFLAFNQDLAPGRVGSVAGFMGCVGSLGGALLVWLIGAMTKTGGFGRSFVLIAVLGVAGLVPMLLVRWEGERT